MEVPCVASGPTSEGVERVGWRDRPHVEEDNVAKSEMDSILLRRGTIGDVDRLVEFWSREGENRDRPADSEEAVRALLARDPDALAIADLHGRIVGTVIAGWDGWRAHLYRLAVASDVRGHGIARLLIGEAERRLAECGAVRFDAMVLAQNTEGAGVWDAMGYVAQQDWTRWVKAARSN